MRRNNSNHQAELEISSVPLFCRERRRIRQLPFMFGEPDLVMLMQMSGSSTFLFKNLNLNPISLQI
jgi:hypothetical protein